TLQVVTDPVDGTSNAANYTAGREGRVSSIVGIGRETIPVPDQLRALGISYNDRGLGIHFNPVDHSGPEALKNDFVKFVRDYVLKMKVGEVSIHFIGNKNLANPDKNKRGNDRHRALYEKLEALKIDGVQIHLDIFSAGTVTPQLLSGIVPGHIYFGVAGSTE